jgi:nicotinate-nucleotide adenylyltransferase
VSERRLGIMGGTFDPIHYGHLVAAEAARWRFALDEVMFVPAGQPWQKPDGVTSGEDRYRMAVLATASNPAFTVSRIELDQPGPTYTIDTLRRLRAELPAGTRLFFIAGADAVAHLHTWVDPAWILELAEIIAVSRPGQDLAELESLEARIAESARTGHEGEAGATGPAMAQPAPVTRAGAGARVHPTVIPQLAISSTELRRRVAAGAPIRYLTPDPVVDYIAEHGLYRGVDRDSRPVAPA